MRKLFIFLVLSVVLFASALEIEQKIYSAIIKALFPMKQTVRIWTDDRSKERFLKNIEGVKLVEDPDRADFLIVSYRKDVDANGMLFVTNYHLLKYYENKAVGGFYWQKGRPNIVFLRPNLQKYRVQLPRSLRQYEEDGL